MQKRGPSAALFSSKLIGACVVDYDRGAGTMRMYGFGVFHPCG